MTERTLRVRTTDGRILPLPAGVAVDHPNKYIAEDKPATVRWCHWLRKRMRAGDLVEVQEEPKSTPRSSSYKAESKE